MDLVLERTTRSEPETREVARELAELLSAGDAVLLAGTLGAGKTVFVKGLAEGLGFAPEDVASPSFALVHDYGTGGRGLRFIHADLYRLRGLPAAEARVEELGLSEARSEGAILAVEWPSAGVPEEGAFAVEIEEGEAGERRIRVRRPPG